MCISLVTIHGQQNIKQENFIFVISCFRGGVNEVFDLLRQDAYDSSVYLLCSSSFYFLFSLSLIHFIIFLFRFFLFTSPYPAPGDGFMFQTRFSSEHPRGHSVLSLSFPLRRSPISIPASMMFSEDQSLHTPFPIQLPT
jgi:hypothetical protein